MKIDFNTDNVPEDATPDELAELANQLVAQGNEHENLADDSDDNPFAEKEPEKKAEEKEAETSDIDKTDDPKDVAGKHENSPAIPYHVLDNTRKQLSATKSLLTEKDDEINGLNDQIKALQDGGQIDKPLSVEAQINGIDEHLKKVSEEFGEEQGEILAPLAAAMKQLTKQNQELSDKVAKADNLVSKQETDEQTKTDEAVTDAIDKSPVMAEWMSRTDQTFAERALDKHKSLLEHNEKYAAMTLDQRMKALPDHVQMEFGDDPNLQYKEGVKPEKKAVEKEEETEVILPSLSDIPGGNSPAGSEIGKLEGASDMQLLSHMENLANNGNLESFLNNIS